MLEKDIRFRVKEVLLSREALEIVDDKSGSVNMIDRIAGGLYGLMRQSLLAGLPEFSMDPSSDAQRDKTADESLLHYNINDLQIPVTGSRSLEILCGILNTVIEELYSGDTVKQIQNNLNKARKAALEMEEALSPMVLERLILITRCDLCPV